MPAAEVNRTDGGSTISVASWPAASNRRGNPYNHLLAMAVEQEGVRIESLSTRRLLRCRYDVVHLHWPEWVLDARSWRRRVPRSVGLIVGLSVARRRGSKLLWTVHNLGAHDSSRRRGVLWRLFLRQVDGFVSHTASGVPTVRAAFPPLATRPAFVVPHGHYRGEYPHDIGRADARERLGIASAATVYLAFGRVRPYKDVVRLVQAFQEVPDPASVLVVAGEPVNDELRRSVDEAARGDDRVHLHLSFVSLSDVQLFFAAADVAVLPYRSIHSSGAAMLALSFDVPVLASDLPVFRELASTVGPDWVQVVDDPLDPVTLVESAARAREVAGSRAPLEAFEWGAIGRATADAYRALVVGSSPPVSRRR